MMIEVTICSKQVAVDELRIQGDGLRGFDCEVGRLADRLEIDVSRMSNTDRCCLIRSRLWLRAGSRCWLASCGEAGAGRTACARTDFQAFRPRAWKRPTNRWFHLRDEK